MFRPDTGPGDPGPNHRTNADGVPDLVTANFGSDDVSVLLGSGDGTFGPQQTFPVGDGPESVAVADLNANGALDLVTANDNSNDVSVLRISNDLN